MATTTSPKPDPQHPPLARDAHGNLVAVPDGTTAWRICRQTTGRPKEILGPDKRSLRFPLELTADELVDLCGADVYRVYGLDEVGKVLDYVTTVDLTREQREVRNVGPDAPISTSLRTAAPPQTSDLRFALEAMAQMMRVNGEALRAVAESQADWVKSISSARGFFRNGPPPLPLQQQQLPPAATHDDEDDEDDLEDDDTPAPSKTIYDVLAPLAEHLAPSVKPVVSMLAAGAAGKVLGGGATPAHDANANLTSKPGWELRELLDLNYAASKAKAKKAASVAGTPREEVAKQSLQARVMSDPKLMGHFIAIKSSLEPDEAAQILAFGERMTDEEQEWLLAKISTLTAQQAASLLRGMLAELGDARVAPADPAA